MRSRTNLDSLSNFVLTIFLCSITASASLFASVNNSEEINIGQSNCVFYPVPKTRWPGFQDMVIDSGGLPWIMANNKVFYFTGIEFKEPVFPESMSSGYYLALWWTRQRCIWNSEGHRRK